MEQLWVMEVVGPSWEDTGVLTARYNKDNVSLQGKVCIDLLDKTFK
jgi:hypothetical protein